MVRSFENGVPSSSKYKYFPRNLQSVPGEFLCLVEFWELQNVWWDQMQLWCVDRDLVAAILANITKSPYQIVTFLNSKYNIIKHNTAYRNALLQPSTSFSNFSAQVKLFTSIQWHSTDKSRYLTAFSCRASGHFATESESVFSFGKSISLSARAGEDLLSWMKRKAATEDTTWNFKT